MKTFFMIYAASGIGIIIGMFLANAIHHAEKALEERKRINPDNPDGVFVDEYLQMRDPEIGDRP